MLEGIFGRLSQLGLSLRSAGRGMESARQVANPGGTAWRLHAMLIDTILDFAGLDYDAVDHRLQPAASPARAMAPDRDQAVVPLRRRLVPARASDRRQGLSLEPQGSTETSRHARGRAHLSRPDGAGALASLAPDARARPRPAHRPTVAGASPCRRARASGTGHGVEPKSAAGLSDAGRAYPAGLPEAGYNSHGPSGRGSLTNCS